MSGLPPAVALHSLADARAALQAAAELDRPVTLVAEGAAGIGWLRAVLDKAQAEFPTAQCVGVLDCGPLPGAVLEALRGGASVVVFTGREDVRGRLADIAEQTEARVVGAVAPRLDLRPARDAVAACRAWLRDSPSLRPSGPVAAARPLRPTDTGMD